MIGGLWVPPGAADLFLSLRLRSDHAGSTVSRVRIVRAKINMSRRNRIVRFVLLTSVTLGHLNAQPEAPLNPPAEFSISSGSTFSASGRAANAWWGESAERPSPVAADIGEAAELIARYHIHGAAEPTNAVTKSAIKGMLRILDPHSNFYAPAEWKELLDEQRSGYTGIGATIANFETNGVTDTFILSIFPGSPASESHLRYGDKIVAIDDEKMTGRSSDMVRDKIRGTVGTTFRLTVERAATLRLETIEIRRHRVPQPSIPDAYILRPGIGYIDLSEGFTYTTSDEFNAAMHKLKRSGMESLILDLRGNGGGIVDQAVKVTEKFLPFGTRILTQRGRTPADNRVWKSANHVPETMSLVVLVNEETASASEIVAGALQDEDRAIIVGEKTFGKGLVQSVIGLPGGTGLTLTTARYLTPSGRSIQRDYSTGDLYDYFNHKTPAAAIDRPFFEARTATNRRVFGGDGIQPDEVVKSDDITAIQASLLDPIFFFTRETVSGRVAGQENYRAETVSFGKRIDASQFSVSDGLLAAFHRFADEGSAGKYSADTLNTASAFIKLRLRYNLIMASFGSISANQVLTEDDPQTAKAVETLPRAAQLANLARKARPQRK